MGSLTSTSKPTASAMDEAFLGDTEIVSLYHQFFTEMTHPDECEDLVLAWLNWVTVAHRFPPESKDRAAAEGAARKAYGLQKKRLGVMCAEVIKELDPHDPEIKKMMAAHVAATKLTGKKARFAEYGDIQSGYGSRARSSSARLTDYSSANRGVSDSYYYDMFGDEYQDNLNGDYYYAYDYDRGYKGSSAKLTGYDDVDYYYNNGAQFGGYYGSNERQRRYHRNRYGRRSLMDHMNDGGDIFGDSNGMDLDSALLVKLIVFISFIALIIIFAVCYRYKMRKYKTNDKYQQIEAQTDNERETSNSITQFPI